MGNTSATGGVLIPSSVSFIEDDPFDNFIQAYIVATTQLPSSLVRPAYQIEPPDLPPLTTNWASFYVRDADGDNYGQSTHNASANSGIGQDEYQEHETVEVLVSFYGPMARSFAKALRYSFKQSQNQEYWRQQNAGFYWTGKIRTVPLLVKERWQYKTDFDFALRRQIKLVTAVENVVSVTGTVTIDNNGNPANGVTETINAQGE